MVIEAEKIEQNMTSRVRHDLLQPAAAMKMLLYRLEQIASDGETRTLATALTAAAEELEESVEAIADYLKLSHGSVERTAVAVPLDDWLGAVVADYAPAVQKAGLSIHVETEEISTTCDIDLLERIVRAFIDNAIDFTDNGAVTVSLRRTPQIEIEVRDCGIGLSPAAGASLTAPFYSVRGEGARRRYRPGLGLATAHEAARLLGGAIIVSNNVDGQGVSARLRLPA